MAYARDPLTIMSAQALEEMQAAAIVEARRLEIESLTLVETLLRQARSIRERGEDDRPESDTAVLSLEHLISGKPTDTWADAASLRELSHQITKELAYRKKSQ